jgi:hypothetical protein
MTPSETRRRLKRRVILFLVIANAALWASYAWLGGKTGGLRSRPHAAATRIHPAQAPAGR